jgi:AcrR family transcriptional regulator
VIDGNERLYELGYQKLTMGDVADAANLHRGLVYLRFKSKDDLVDAVVLRELNRYADAWRAELDADPRAGSVASIYRAMVRSLKTLPLASAIVARDEQVLGRYLRKRGSLPTIGTEELLRIMQEAGALRAGLDIGAVAYLLDSLTPALRRTFAGGDSELLVETLAEVLESGLTPDGAGDLAGGKAALLNGFERVRGDLDKWER